MTVRNYSIAKDDNAGRVVKWAGLLNADSGQVYKFTELKDRSVQVTGTFDGAVTIQGSNDGVNFATLTDHTGVLLSFTSAGVRFIAEAVLYIKPVVAAGSTAANEVNLFEV